MLDALKVKRATCPEGKRQVKLYDAKGLFLLVRPNGSKLWRFRYQYAGREKLLALGSYPEVSLKEARDLAEEARAKLTLGEDPAHDRTAKRAAAKKTGDCFENVALAWMERQRTKWTPRHTAKMNRWLQADILPWIGDKAPNAIDGQDILAILRRIESDGHIEKAHRVKAMVQRIFAYAMAHGLAKRNPAGDFKARDALPPQVVKHRATIKTPKEAGALMRAITDYQGDFSVRCALLMLAYVFTRPGELRYAEWTEVDLDAATWRIPAEKMKMRRPHIVPLARQVLAILKELRPLTGDGRYLFSSMRTRDRPMSENTLNAALRRMGYSKDEMCSHGFRGMASTLLHEQGWPSDVVERQLAHGERNAVKAAYNHAEHLEEHREMMQSWADWLDALRDGASVVPIKARR
jgi:integrase